MPPDRSDVTDALGLIASCVECALRLVRVLRRLDVVTPELEEAVQMLVEEANVIEDDLYPQLEDF